MFNQAKKRQPVQMEGLEGRTLLTTSPGALRFALPLGATQDGVTSDEFGSAYLVGRFTGTVDFNPSSRKVYALTAANAGGDMFVARYFSNGSLAWAVRLAGASGLSTPAD